jgi:beta-lactamase superfamily II metal-dependent hydrolase
VYVPDTSLTNASSITVILRGEGTSMLFLGDAWAEDVVSQLKAAGLSTPLFDVIKIAHHGSRSNSSVDLLEQVDAPCFLISSDGSRHGHPDFEVLAEIVDRPAPFERAIYFNYETPAARQLRAYTSRSHTPFRVHTGHNDWINVGGELH